MQNCWKSSVEEGIFDYMASNIECRFNKNSLLQCYILAISPAGLVFYYEKQELPLADYITKTKRFIKKEAFTR